MNESFGVSTGFDSQYAMSGVIVVSSFVAARPVVTSVPARADVGGGVRAHDALGKVAPCQLAARRLAHDEVDNGVRRRQRLRLRRRAASELDGKPIAEKVDGTPIEVDPGEHEFTLTAPGEAPVKLKVVLREGDRARRERVVIGAPPPETALATGPGAPAIAAADRGASQRLVALGLGLGGVAAIGMGTAFGLSASAKWSSAQDGCSSASACPDHDASVRDRDGAKTAATLSTIAFIAGGAAMAAGAVLYLTAPKGPKRTGLGVTPFGMPSGGGLSIQGVL